VSLFRSGKERVADELAKLYAEYTRLARQLEEQAGAAPYPHVGDRLRELFARQQVNAQDLLQHLAALGRQGKENGEAIHGGRNSWERLVSTLEDYRALLRRLSELYIRWHDDHPEEADLLHRLREDAVRHREAIVDLIARSDPHAID
jgi:hypothetical protein